MKNIIVKKTKNGNLFVVSDYDKATICEKLKDREYECKIIQSRNIKHLGKYWMLLKALEFHFSNTDEGYHLFFKELFLPPIEFILKSGIIKKYPNSIAFDKMDQLAFNDYYQKIENWLIEKGYNIDELIETSRI